MTQSLRAFMALLFSLFLAACGQDPQANAPDREVDMGNGYTATAKSVPAGTTIEECATLYSGEANCPDVDGDNAYPVSSSDPFNVLMSPSCLCLSAGNPGSGWDVVTDATEIAIYDCNDNSDTVYTGATEVCDSVDNDCDSSVDETGGMTMYYADSDGDEYGDPLTTSTACEIPDGFVGNDSDCDDGDELINPSAAEVCDELDNNCDGDIDDDDSAITGQPTWYLDGDMDGYTGASTQVSCDQPAMSEMANEGDCDDATATRSPGNSEVCDSGNVDEDCDMIADDMDSSATGQPTWYLDGDMDGYTGASTQVSCDQPAWSELSNESDCNDASGTVHPGASEVCNSTDDDCDGSTDEGVQTTFYADADMDTYGNLSSTLMACSLPSGYVTNSTDCDDADSADHPGGTEVCNGDDEDCDGVADDGVKSTVYSDMDMDGYGDESASSTSACIDSTHVTNHTDCNDDDSDVNPGATDADNDGSDQDCDGETWDMVCASQTYTTKSWQLWLSDLTTFPWTPADPDWVAPGYAQGVGTLCASFLLVEGDNLKFNAIIDYSGNGVYGDSSDKYGFSYPSTNNFTSMTIMGMTVNLANAPTGDVTQLPWTYSTSTGNDGSVFIDELPN